MEPPTDFPGSIILSELGRGTTGIVYKARCTHTNRLVALKTPLPGPEAEYLARCTQLFWEFQALASLRHPHIVSLFEACELHGRPWLVRELVDGDTLKALTLTKAIHLRDGLRVLGQIAEAVHHVHEQCFAHRNLRASNVLLDRNGRAVLIGFGRVGFLPGSPNLPPGMAGTLAEVDIRGLQDLVTWLSVTLGELLPPELAQLCEPGAVASPRAFAEAVSRFT